jgi:hypothetical protein
VMYTFPEEHTVKMVVFCKIQYTIKKVSDFPRDSLVSDFPAGYGKIDNLFYSVYCTLYDRQRTCGFGRAARTRLFRLNNT